MFTPIVSTGLIINNIKTIIKSIDIIETNSELNFVIKPSKIHGVGIFCNDFIPESSFLFYLILKPSCIITKLGSKINHSYFDNNTDIIEDSDGWFIRSTKNIPIGTEIVCNYDNTPFFIVKAYEKNYL